MPHRLLSPLVRMAEFLVQTLAERLGFVIISTQRRDALRRVTELLNEGHDDELAALLGMLKALVPGTAPNTVYTVPVFGKESIVRTAAGWSCDIPCRDILLFLLAVGGTMLEGESEELFSNFVEWSVQSCRGTDSESEQQYRVGILLTLEARRIAKGEYDAQDATQTRAVLRHLLPPSPV